MCFGLLYCRQVYEAGACISFSSYGLHLHLFVFFLRSVSPGALWFNNDGAVYYEEYCIYRSRAGIGKAEQEKRAVNKAIVYEENSFEGLEAVEAKAG